MTGVPRQLGTGVRNEQGFAVASSFLFLVGCLLCRLERVSLTLQGVQLQAETGSCCRRRSTAPGAQFSPGDCCAAKPCILSRRPLAGTLPVTGAQPLTLPLRRAAHTPPAGRLRRSARHPPQPSRLESPSTTDKTPLCSDSGPGV